MNFKSIVGGVYDYTKELEKETGSTYTVKDLAEDMFGVDHQVIKTNDEIFHEVTSNVFPGNYKERFNEKVVMNYAYVDNMDYKGLKRVYADLKKAVGRLDIGEEFEFLDYRRIAKEDREVMMRANVQRLYSFYFSYSSYTVEYSAGYKQEFEITSSLAEKLLKEMHTYDGFSGVDTYKENLNILREYYGYDLSALSKAIYLSSISSSDIMGTYAKSAYYKKPKRIDDIDVEDEKDDEIKLSDYEMMVLAATLVSRLPNQKSMSRTTAKIVKTPKVR